MLWWLLNEIHLRCVVWHHRNFHLAAGRNSNLTNFISLFSAAFVEFKVKLSEMNSNDVRTQGNINHSAAPTTTTTTTTWIMFFSSSSAAETEMTPVTESASDLMQCSSF